MFPREQNSKRLVQCRCTLADVTYIYRKTTEYNISIYLAFVDFNNAFDSIETRSFLNGLNNTRIGTMHLSRTLPERNDAPSTSTIIQQR